MALARKGADHPFVQRPVSNAQSNYVGCSVPSLINLTRVDLASIRLVVVCASQGSLTRAAPLCNMSLMTASRRLRRLEAALGCTIFHRGRILLEPTKAGLVVIKSAQTVVQLVHDMVQNVLCIPSPCGHVHENTGRSGKQKIRPV